MVNFAYGRRPFNNHLIYCHLTQTQPHGHDRTCCEWRRMPSAVRMRLLYFILYHSSLIPSQLRRERLWLSEKVRSRTRHCASLNWRVSNHKSARGSERDAYITEKKTYCITMILNISSNMNNPARKLCFHETL